MDVPVALNLTANKTLFFCDNTHVSLIWSFVTPCIIVYIDDTGLEPVDPFLPTLYKAIIIETHKLYAKRVCKFLLICE